MQCHSSSRQLSHEITKKAIKAAIKLCMHVIISYICVTCVLDPCHVQQRQLLKGYSTPK